MRSHHRPEGPILRCMEAMEKCWEPSYEPRIVRSPYSSPWGTRWSCPRHSIFCCTVIVATVSQSPRDSQISMLGLCAKRMVEVCHGERPTLTGPRCASVHGFSLHANTQAPAHRRDQLERLIRYTARGAVSLERLQEDANGNLVYTFTHPWSDGTTGIRLSPLELWEKLAALVPLPRVHLVRYGGCLAPHSHLRGAIIPTPRQQGIDGEEAQPGTPYWPWARLLGRVFGLDMATCPFCRRGTLRIMAVLTQESVITRILRYLQLASVPPP